MLVSFWCFKGQQTKNWGLEKTINIPWFLQPSADWHEALGSGWFNYK
jgi:hypothetical protein